MAVDVEPYYLRDLGTILGTAAVISLVAQRLRQPPVLGYLLAGVLLGPHVPGIVVGNLEMTHTLSELGVILLMFSIGLEFSIRKIARVGLAGGLTAAIEVGLMVSLGYLVGRLLGWTWLESLFIGACIGISSTMLVARAFEEQRLRGGFAEVAFAVLVFEDIIAMVLLAILTAVASGAGLSAAEFTLTIGRLLGFLVAMLAGGLLIVPRFIRGVVGLGRREATLIAGIAVCFIMAGLAHALGYSVALGAFLAGMLVAESGEGAKVEQVIQPLKDIFAAIFFIAIGMAIDPLLVAQHWLPVLLLTAVVLIGKTVGVSLGSFLVGHGVQNSVRAGMSLAQIGEFSFIIAALGISSKATGDFVFPVAVAVSCLTALTTPWMVRRSQSIAARIDRRMPERLQTFVTFYESWIEQLRSAPRSRSRTALVRRGVVWLVIEAALLAATIAASSLLRERIGAALAPATGLSPELLGSVWLSLGFCLGLILFFGVLRRGQRLAGAIAGLVLPLGEAGKLDLGSAPRRAFTLVLELVLALAVGMPLMAFVQPFLPLSSGMLVLALILSVLTFAAWRSITNLQGHVRAGTELIVEVLARQSREGEAHPGADALEQVHTMLPGFPEMVPVRLEADSPVLGQTLAAVNLRARTGATVLAINRAEAGVVLPTAGERLLAGDVLTLAGPQEAIEAARAVLGAADVPGPEESMIAFSG
ncbi:MAG: cation:proton antiporter [Nannocystis sp.]|nr:cation:proton antiporter [Nannocystis sp.]MBA3546720.1 cation:proton antiporter [Nannocystis sp.]